MNTESNATAAGWSLFQSILDSSNLQPVLLVGSGIVALAFLAISLTRFGAARPLWKCVILSVMAHVLLIGFAWGTHLIVPSQQEELTLSEPMRVNFNDDQGQSPDRLLASSASAPSAATSPNWDKFSQDSPLDAFPGLSSLDSTPQRNSVNGMDFTAPPAPNELNAKTEKLKSDLPRQRQLTAARQTMPLQSLTLERSLQMAAADRDRQLQRERRNRSGPPLTGQPIAPLETPLEVEPTVAPLAAQPVTPVQRNGSRESVDQDARMKKSQLDALANVFEDGEFVSSTQDAMATPAASEGVFESPTPSAQKPPERKNRETVPRAVSGETGVFEPAADLPLPATSSSNNSFAEMIPKASSPAPARRADGNPMPAVYAMRSEANRMEAVLRQGGSRETEEAVQKALAWLADNQSRDGRWNPRLLGGGREDRVLGHNREGAGAQSDSGITALALLAFMANGHTHLEGPYQNVIQMGLEYLIAQQSADGELAGRAKLFARMYCHSMSLLAISEAYALTGDRRLAVSVQRGVNYSIAAQNPRDGGWRYQPGDEGDMSQFGWQVMALHSAEIAGIDIPQSTKDRMADFLERCCRSPHGGISSYRAGQGPNTTMTAEALFCRSLLGQNIPSETMQEANDRISRQLPSTDRINMYYWYYGTLATYISGGEAWARWNQKMKATLLELQVTSGPNEGSWEPNGLWAGYGGRTYSTAMAALTLEVYYRYLPVYDVANRNRLNELR